MKIFKQILGVVVLSFAFSGLGYACSLASAGSNSVASFFCVNTGEDANYCYFSCECRSGTWSQCDDLLAKFGYVD